MNSAFVLMPPVSSALIVMAVFGAAWSTLFWFSTDVLAQFLAEKDVSRLYKKNPGKSITQAKTYTSGKNLRAPLAAGAVLLLPFLPILLAFIPVEASPFFFGGFGITTLALVAINGRRWMKNFRIGASRRIARFFLSNGKKDEIDQVLEGIYRQNRPQLQAVGIKAMGEWGSDYVLRILLEASQSSNPDLAELAEQTRNKVLRRLGEARPLSVRNMKTYFDEYDHWDNEVEENAALPEERVAYTEKRDAVKRMIGEIIQSQMHLRNASPDNYCMECFTFSEEVVYLNWRFVRCKSCKDALHLQRGIKTAIGRIGPVPSPNPNPEGVFYLDLWDGEKNSSQPGEVEKIEIVSGLDIKYEWAISAVTEGMQNRFPDQEISIPVEIDSTIAVSNNTRNILGNIASHISHA